MKLLIGYDALLQDCIAAYITHSHRLGRTRQRHFVVTTFIAKYATASCLNNDNTLLVIRTYPNRIKSRCTYRRQWCLRLATLKSFVHDLHDITCSSFSHSKSWICLFTSLTSSMMRREWPNLEPISSNVVSCSMSFNLSLACSTLSFSYSLTK